MLALTQTSCSHSGEPAGSQAKALFLKSPAASSPNDPAPAATTDAVSGEVAPLQDEPASSPLNAPPPPAAVPPSATAPRPVAVTRLLIYHAEVRLKTAAMPRATTRLDSLVRHSGGYLSAATETHVDGEWRQETTIRVPPARFQALLNGLAGLGTVEAKKLSTDDVTAEHADVAARLQAKRAVEQQYTVLLTRAKKIQDILDIEEKLNAVREEIEATESRLKTMNDEVAYATISLTLYQPLVQTIPDAPVVSLGSRVVDAFYGGWQLLTSLLVNFISIWPLVVVSAGGWWLWQRRRAARTAAGPPPAMPS